MIFFRLIFFFCAMNPPFLFPKETYVFHRSYYLRPGMFASATEILGQLVLFEEGEIGSLRVDFGNWGLYYDPQHGENWWDYYFEPIQLGVENTSGILHPSKKEYRKAFLKRIRLTRRQVAAIVERYVRVKPHILKKRDDFAAREFDGFFIIGVHYRGTDKKTENPLVPYEKVFKEIENRIPPDLPFRIFIATDEEFFLRSIETRFPGRVFSIPAHRSKGAEGVHFLYKNSYEIGEEALLDCLLLSKCSFLIRTPSHLGLWSTYFSPDLPVVLLEESNEDKRNVGSW